MQKRSIAELNDAFRRGLSNVPGKVVITQGISALGQEAVNTIISSVQLFDDFTQDNDPYGEHDFGSFFYEDVKCFWKIDCFDPTLQFYSEDPTDVSKTVRVLTIMRAEEY